jgi:hypothetical protein
MRWQARSEAFAAVATLATFALGAAACSGKPAAKGRIVVAVSLDWEGASVSSEGLDAVDVLRKQLGAAPLTHFVSAAYFTKDVPDPRAASLIAGALRPGDELAVHLHAWRSLARASGIEPKLSPSFATGTDKLFEFEDGDVGFDTDLDVYSVPELRALIRTSRRLLEQTHVTVSRTFRAGGYLGTPKVLQAIREEGYTVDSSATDYRQIDEGKDTFMLKRVQEVWPKTEATTQPYFLDEASHQVLEMPIAATADYVTAADVVITFEAAEARLKKDPTHDVFVVIGCNQETADDFAARLGEAIAKVRTEHPLADHLWFTTVEKAATLARSAVAPGP